MALNPLIIARAAPMPQPNEAIDYDPSRNEEAASAVLKARQDAQDRAEAMRAHAAFQDALRQTGGNYDKALDILDQRGINTIGQRESLAKSRKATLDAAAQQYDVVKKQHDALSGYAAQIHDQASLDKFRPLMVQTDPELEQQIPTVFDPAAFQGFAGLGETGNKILDRNKQALDAYNKGEFQSGFGRAVSGTLNDDDLKAAKDFARRIGTPESVIQQIAPDSMPWSPQLAARAATLSMSPKDQAELAAKPDSSAKVGSFEDYVTRKFGANPTPEQVLQARKEYGQSDDRPRVSVSVGGVGSNDVKESVAGMKEGTIPPQLPGRASKDYTAIMAEAHRQKFDLVKANEDWVATQKYLATLNGAQQTRLRQATEQVSEMLPGIRSLVKEWDSAGIPGLSYATLQAAKSGSFGNKAQSLANRLDGQIADLTSDLGTVYKGGNSSTDESLKLAAKNLQGQWSKQAALDALDQIETNIRYRKNSMRLPPVTGTAGENQYAPPGLNQGASSGGSSSLQVGQVVSVKGKQIKVTKVLSNGQFEGVPVQ